MCQNMDNALDRSSAASDVYKRQGEVLSPENSLLYVFGQANPAPTADDGIGRLSFDTLPFYFNVS